MNADTDAKVELPVTANTEERLPTLADDLPVVARLIIEVRSDGSRTVARGAMEDAGTGTRASIEAAGTTPLELALSLAKTLFSAPWLQPKVAGHTLRRLLKK